VPVYLHSIGSALGAPAPIRELPQLAADPMLAEYLASSGLEHYRRADETPPELAARAIRATLDRAGLDPRQIGTGHGEMANGNWHVLRLHIRRQNVNHIEVLRQAHQVVGVGQGAGTFAQIEVGDVRWAAYAGENNRVSANFDGALFAATPELELSRRRSNRLGDQPAVETHQPFVAHRRPRLLETRARLLVQHANPKFLQYPQGGVVYGRDSILAECRLPDQRVGESAVGTRPRNRGGSVRGGATPAPVTAPFAFHHCVSPGSGASRRPDAVGIRDDSHCQPTAVGF
jgi:hypothetical protein